MTLKKPNESGRTQQHPRLRSRAYALRLLFQSEILESTPEDVLNAGSYLVENSHSRDCVCVYLDECRPRNYYNTYGEWPMDYVCPHEDLPPTEKRAACRRATTCSCRRYYDVHKTCPPKGYPFQDGDFSVDRCYCPEYKNCEYHTYFDMFATEPDDFALAIARGVGAHRVEIDQAIEEVSLNWTLSRMPVVDLCILRIAVWEMNFSGDTPASVAINEAVRLAKTYGGEDSFKFVNGVLGKIAKQTEELS